MHITPQFGPVILVIQCHSHRSSQGGSVILVTKTSDQTRQRGHTLSTYTNLTCPLLPCYSLDNPGWQLLNQPFSFYIFFAFHPCLPRFPHGVYNYFAVSCAFSPLFGPPQSYSRSRYRRPRSHLRYSPRFRLRSRPVCVRVCVCVGVGVCECVFIKLS